MLYILRFTLARRQLTLEEINRAVRLLHVGTQQSDAADRIGVSQSIIRRLWNNFGETARPTEPQQRRYTTVV